MRRTRHISSTVELGLGFEFHLASEFFAPRRIDDFGETSTLGLDADSNLEVRGHGTPRRRIDQHKEGRGNANIRVDPERDNARADALIGNDGKRRTSVAPGKSEA
jgi:hypothetical protein